MLALIAVCKCHPKFTPGGAETGTSAGEGEGQEYEQMDTVEGGVAVSDPTYMEVGAAEGKTFELQQNEAYAPPAGVASAGEGEGQEYEQMDTGMPVSDPTYMEVGAAEGTTFELKQNEAYGTHAGK